MAQYAVWTALADEGIGAHFNYYNPAIDYRVSQHLQINPYWKLQTQMVFGSIEQVIGNTTMLPNEAEFMVLS
jgi:predicted oxidoreductase (fatty acid repression mutant protein)